jgi:hypothetical protein
VSYKSSIFCDVEFGLGLCESVVVFHPLRCELTVVRIDDVVCAMVGKVESADAGQQAGLVVLTIEPLSVPALEGRFQWKV